MDLSKQFSIQANINIIEYKVLCSLIKNTTVKKILAKLYKWMYFINYNFTEILDYPEIILLKIGLDDHMMMWYDGLITC